MIEIDESRCEGLGICESLAPDMFEVNGEGVSSLRDRSGHTGLEEVTDQVHAAVESCPMQALRLVAVQAPRD